MKYFLNDLTKLLPNLMDETGIDMWIVNLKEYNEVSVLKNHAPQQWLDCTA